MKKDKTPICLIKFTLDAQEYQMPLYDQVGFGLTPNEIGQIKRLTNMQALGATMLAAVGDYDGQVHAALLVIAVTRTGGNLDIAKLFDGTTGFESEVTRVETPTVAPVEKSSEATAPGTRTIPGITGAPIS